MRDADLWFPYDNEPVPNRYTVLVEAKVYSSFDVEAYSEDDISINFADVLANIDDHDIDRIEIEDGRVIRHSEEDALRDKIQQLEKKIEELEANNSEVEWHIKESD